MAGEYMNSYELFVDECYKNNVIVIEKKFKSKAKGLWKDYKIGISSDLLTIAEKNCILAEEYGHFKTTCGNILDLNDIRSIKQEIRARNDGYERLCSIEKIISAIEKGALDNFEIAEYLNITNQYLHEAINYHKRRYGLYCRHNNYIVFFEPTVRIVRVDNRQEFLV